MENKIYTGIIKFYKNEAGFGFITCAETQLDYFFHINSANFSYIQKGDEVTFELTKSKKRPDSVEAANVALKTK